MTKEQYEKLKEMLGALMMCSSVSVETRRQARNRVCKLEKELDKLMGFEDTE